MKVSLHWLKRFVDFDLNASQLADQLTMRGFESEVVTDFNSLDNVVVGDVLSAQKHPDADKLKLCTVSDGNEEFSVVCAHYFEVCGLGFGVLRICRATNSCT